MMARCDYSLVLSTESRRWVSDEAGNNTSGHSKDQMDRVHQIVIEPESWLPVVGMLVLAALALVPLLRAAKQLRALGIVKSSPGMPAAIERDYRVVRSVVHLEVLWRALLGVGALFIAWLFFLNAYGWFRRVDITEHTVRFGYCWPRGDSMVDRKDIAGIETHANRNHRRHLIVITRQGQRLRSISTDQPGLVDGLVAELPLVSPVR